MGIDYIINPDLTTAIEIERYLLKKYNFYSDDFVKGKVLMVDFNIGNIEGFVGRKIKDIEGLEGILITAISREGDLIIPNGSTKLIEYDVIHVIGKSKIIKKLGERLGINMEKGILKGNDSRWR